MITRVFRLLAVVALAAFGATTDAAAHDPGLSSTSITLSPNAISTTMVFHQADYAAIAGTTQAELELYSGGQPFTQDSAKQTSVEGDSTSVTRRFGRTGSEAFRIVVPVLALLPPGHKHFVEVLDAGGSIVASSMLSAGADSFEVSLSKEDGSHSGGNAAKWVSVGITHILEGHDHLLFVFLLLLGAGSIGASARLITAFTAGHSMSLALAVVGVIHLSAMIVEPAIAASILVVAVLGMAGVAGERTALAFGFGLIHGLGFASVLVDAGIGSAAGGTLVATLFAFNLGVEIGQIGVALAIFPVLAALRTSPAFRLHGVRFASAAAAVCAVVWLAERIAAS